MFHCVSFVAALLCPVLLLASPQKAHTKSFCDLDRLVRTCRWEEAGKVVRRGLRSGALSPTEIQELAGRYPGTPFSNAYAGAKAILKLHGKTGLTLATTLPITLFAESNLSEETLKGTFSWNAHRYGRELQYDPETKFLYIHLGTHGIKPLGAGWEKIVTKTVQYHRLHPTVMARSAGKRSLEREAKTLRDLRGCPGVINAEGLMQREGPSGPVPTIITKIYNAGTLQKVILTSSPRLSLREKISIAADIMTGLASMHEHGYIHRDLSARNYFVNVSKLPTRGKKITAVVADLGWSIPVSEANGVAVQGNKGYIAPEGFFRERLHQTDYFKTDIFAAGTALWQLYYGRIAPWLAKNYFIQREIPIKKRHRLVLAAVSKARAAPLGRLRAKARGRKKATLDDRFVSLILQMTDPRPERRGTADELKEKFLSLIR